MEKDLSIETNPRTVASFVWEIEANIGKLPSQKIKKAATTYHEYKNRFF